MNEAHEPPDWVTYPDEAWERLPPAEAGFEQASWDAWIGQQNPHGAAVAGERHPGEEWGAVVVRGGYLVAAWGDPDYRYQSASVGKCFTRLCLQAAVDRGVIGSVDDRVADYWTGDGQLNHPDKYLDQGHHRTVTFKHLLTMQGGFPVSNGCFWRRGEHPDWAEAHDGDPDRASFAQRPPGEGYHYSSGGFWRCTQALTHLFVRELKDVLDEAVFSHMGIPAQRWDWFTGQHVRETVDLYPEWPGYGEFLDPPYEIRGKRVQGGGGWVVISASDLARVGVLLAGGGLWRGEVLLSAGEFVTEGQSSEIRGWNGGNSSTLSAWTRSDQLVIAAVTTAGLDWRHPPRPTRAPETAHAAHRNR